MAETRKAREVPDRQLTEDEGTPVVMTDDPDDLGGIQTPQDVVEEHKRQIADAERRFQAESEARQRAERERAEALQRANSVQNDAYAAQETAIQNQIETQTSAAQSAQAAYRAARENSDIDAEMKALDALTNAKTALATLANQKNYLSILKQQQPTRTNDPNPVDNQNTYRGPHGYSKVTEDWLSGHPKYDSDSNYRMIVDGAAMAARRDGIPADTPGFFRYVEERVKTLYKDPNEMQMVQPKAPVKPSASQAAPPSRDSGQRNTPIQQNGQISATAVARAMGVSTDDLRDYAKINNMSFENYVREQAEIIQESQQGRNTGLYKQGDFG